MLHILYIFVQYFIYILITCILYCYIVYIRLLLGCFESDNGCGAVKRGALYVTPGVDCVCFLRTVPFGVD